MVREMQIAYALLKAAEGSLGDDSTFTRLLSAHDPTMSIDDAKRGIAFLAKLLVNADALSDTAVDAWIRETARKDVRTGYHRDNGKWVKNE